MSALGAALRGWRARWCGCWLKFLEELTRRCPACGSKRGPWVLELDHSTGTFLRPYCWDCHASGVLLRTALKEPRPANYYLNDAQFTQRLGEIFAGRRPVEEEP